MASGVRAYRQGAIYVANGSTTVHGVGTQFIGNAWAGSPIRLPDGQIYAVTVDAAENDQLTIDPPYQGTTIAEGDADPVYLLFRFTDRLAAAAVQTQRLKEYLDSNVSIRRGTTDPEPDLGGPNTIYYKINPSTNEIIAVYAKGEDGWGPPLSPGLTPELEALADQIEDWADAASTSATAAAASATTAAGHVTTAAGHVTVASGHASAAATSAANAETDATAAAGSATAAAASQTAAAASQTAAAGSASAAATSATNASNSASAASTSAGTATTKAGEAAVSAGAASTSATAAAGSATAAAGSATAASNSADAAATSATNAANSASAASGSAASASAAVSSAETAADAAGAAATAAAASAVIAQDAAAAVNLPSSLAGQAGKVPKVNATEDGWDLGAGGGDVTGPASVTADGNIALYNGTGGKLIKDGGTRAAWLAGAGYPSSNVASDATCDIGAANTVMVRVTGTTTITSFGSQPNRERIVTFAGALTLTHNATSLILPNGLNIETAAEDAAAFTSDSSGNWRCLWYRRANGKLGVLNNKPQAPLHIGDLTTAPLSVDTMALIRRNIDNTGAGNAHGFADNSVVNRSGAVGVNSFDAFVTFEGTASYDHYVSFQSRPDYDSDGAINDVGGFFHTAVLDGGTVGMHYGMWLKNPTGSATVTNNYGIYIEPQTKGTNNWQLYSTGAAPSYFNGPLRIGLAAGNGIFGLSCAVDVAGTDAATSGMGFARYQAAANGPTFMFAKSRHASAGSHTVVQSGDDLGVLYFAGSDGTQFIEGGRILAEVDGTPGTNDMPGRLVFGTTSDGAAAVTDRLAIDSQGRVRPVANGLTKLGGDGLGFDGLQLSDSDKSHSINLVYGKNLSANASLNLASMLTDYSINLFADSGRFAGPSAATEYATTFALPSYISLYNGASSANYGKFITNNNDYGGAAGALATEVKSLIDKCKNSAYRRYGVEFFIAQITSGSGTASSAVVEGGASFYFSSFLTFGPRPPKLTFRAHIRALDAPILYVGYAGLVAYKDGVEQPSQFLISPADGWVTLLCLDSLNPRSSVDYSPMPLRIYCSASGHKYLLACPALMGGLTDVDNNVLVVPGVNRWLV